MSPKRQPLFLYFVAVSAAIGGFLFGYDTAVISGTISLVTTQFGLGTLQEGWFVSSALVGCIGGVSIAGEASDRFGRKSLLLVSGFLFSASSLGCAIADSFGFLVISRLVGGLGVGIASMVAPLYISEVSPASVRGRLVALYQFAITVGILLAYFVNAVLLHQSTRIESSAGLAGKIFVDEVWRAMFGAEIIPSLVFIAVALVVPRSPRWLVSKGRSIEAARVLARIDHERSTQEEIGEIERALANEPAGRWAALFQPGLRIALFAGVALAVLSQITGINAIIYFGPRILEEAGLKIGDALGGQVIIGLVNVTATIGAILVIDKLGRKKLMSAGTFAMAVTLLVVSFLFATGKTDGTVLLFFIICYIAAFAVGYGPVIWTLLAEIYPTRIRGRAMSVATFALWIGTAFIGQVVPWMLKVLTPAVTFLVFAICCIPVFLVLRLIPETKGKSLEEIERFWLR